MLVPRHSTQELQYTPEKEIVKNRYLDRRRKKVNFMARLTISFYFELNICVLEVLASVSGSNNSPGNYLLSPRDSPHWSTAQIIVILILWWWGWSSSWLFRSPPLSTFKSVALSLTLKRVIVAALAANGKQYFHRLGNDSERQEWTLKRRSPPFVSKTHI